MLQSGLGVVDFYGRTMDSKELNDDGAHISQDDVRRAQQALQELRDFKDSMKWKDFLRVVNSVLRLLPRQVSSRTVGSHYTISFPGLSSVTIAFPHGNKGGVDPKACLQVRNWLVDVAHECGVALCKREPKPEEEDFNAVFKENMATLKAKRTSLTWKELFPIINALKRVIPQKITDHASKNSLLLSSRGLKDVTVHGTKGSNIVGADACDAIYAWFSTLAHKQGIDV